MGLLKRLSSGGLRVRLAIEPEAVRLGEGVRVRSELVGRPDPDADRLELRLTCTYTHKYYAGGAEGARDYRTLELEEPLERHAFEPGEAALEPGSVHEAAFTVPANAPPSAADRWNRVPYVEWRVEARISRREGRDVSTSQPLTVLDRIGRATDWALSVGRGHPDWSEDFDRHSGRGRLLVFGRADAERCCALTLQLEERELAAGGTLRGSLEVRPRRDADVPAKGIEVLTGAIESHRTLEHPDFKDALGGHASLYLGGGETLRAGRTYSFPFELTLPEGFPPSLPMPMGSVRWYAAAALDHGPRGPRAPVHTHTLLEPIAVHNADPDPATP